MECNEIKQRKARFFLEKAIEVHINKLDKSFYNGFIITVNEHYFELNDRKLGRVPVYWDEIDNDSITEYRERQ